MPPFLFRCPNTGYRVQAFASDEDHDPKRAVVVTCTVCARTHYVVPETNGPDRDDEEQR